MGRGGSEGIREVVRERDTAVLKGNGDQSEDIARFDRLYLIFFYLDPLVLYLLFPVNHVCN